MEKLRVSNRCIGVRAHDPCSVTGLGGHQKLEGTPRPSLKQTFKLTFMGVPVVAHYRADGKGILISADLRMPCTWEVKGNDQVCISDERSNFCWKYQHSKKNPEEYVRTSSPGGHMQILKVEDGIPDF